MEKKFNEKFIYSEGEKVNIVKILIYLDVNGEESGGGNFKNWAIKNKIIKEPFEIEKEGRSYYLKNYKEWDQCDLLNKEPLGSGVRLGAYKKELNFTSDTKENTRYPSSPTGSVRSSYTTTTVLPEEFLSKMNEMYETFNKEKDNKSEIKVLYEKLVEKTEKLKKEKKELVEKNKLLEEENKKMKKYVEDPEVLFDKLKDKYEEVVDIAIYTRPKKNKVRKYIINGKLV